MYVLYIPNGCFDFWIFKYHEKVKLISHLQRVFLNFFNGLLEFASFP